LQPGSIIFLIAPQGHEFARPAGKIQAGTVGFLTMYPSGPPNMPKFLGLWFVLLPSSRLRRLSHGYTVAFGARYPWCFALQHRRLYVLRPGTSGQQHLEGSALECNLKETFDGLVYSMLTAGTFGWLWPADFLGCRRVWTQRRAQRHGSSACHHRKFLIVGVAAPV